MRIKNVVLLLVGLLIIVIAAMQLTPFVMGLLDPYSLPGSDWAIFQRNFITPQGRVIDTGNENVSHSEGQGYGMLIAVAYGDRKVFDRIWQWTRQNLQVRPNDKLLSWKWQPDGGEQDSGAIADPNNASDGDLLVAWALVRASHLWNEYSYQQAAAQILTDLARLDLRQAPDGPYLLPGTDGFVESTSITINPSYYIFPALTELAAAFPGSPWSGLSTAGQAMIEKARFGKWNLTPDWATVEHLSVAVSEDQPQVVSNDQVVASPTPEASAPPAEQATPAGSEPVAAASPSASATATPDAPSPTPTPDESVAAVASPTPSPEQIPQAPEEKVASPGPTLELSKKFPPFFGYNAIRVPLHLAWQNPSSSLLRPFVDFWKSLGNEPMPATVDLENNSFGPDPALPGMQAIATYATACADKGNLTVRAIPVLTKGDSYFSASLVLLTKIAVRESFGKK